MDIRDRTSESEQLRKTLTPRSLRQLPICSAGSWAEKRTRHRYPDHESDPVHKQWYDAAYATERCENASLPRTLGAPWGCRASWRTSWREPGRLHSQNAMQAVHTDRKQAPTLTGSRAAQAITLTWSSFAAGFSNAVGAISEQPATCRVQSDDVKKSARGHWGKDPIHTQSHTKQTKTDDALFFSHGIAACCQREAKSRMQEGLPSRWGCTSPNILAGPLCSAAVVVRKMMVRR